MLAPVVLLLLPMAVVPLLGVIVMVLYFFSSCGVSLGLLARTWKMFVIEVLGDWVRDPGRENFSDSWVILHLDFSSHKVMSN